MSWEVMELPTILTEKSGQRGGVTMEQTILYIDRNIFTGLLNLIAVRLESNPISVVQPFYVKRLCSKNRIYLLKFLFLRIKSLIFNIVTL
jgi:hypothetical protein